jgi:hypothetical protein
MKILLAIPSYNRPYEIEKRAGFWLKKLPKEIEWKVFVRKEQLIYYSQSIPRENLVGIEVNSFRETINAIGQYAVSNQYDYVHKVDDDMSFKQLGNAKKENTHEVYQSCFEVIKSKLMSSVDIGAVSISKPMSHIRQRDKIWIRENKSIYGNYFIKSELMFMPEGIELFDDVFFTLKILELRMSTLSYSGAYEDSVMLKNAGGLQSYNRNKLSRDTIKIMQSYFPQVQEGIYKGNENIVDIDLKALGIK